MSHKMSAARREAFLRALSQSGNQTLAAEQARVSRSWVHLQRAADPAFDKRVRESVAIAKAALRAAPGLEPTRRTLRWQDGQELVVRGTHGRRTQIARARLKQWTPRAEERFLAELAGTCNVKAACAAVGLTVPSVYVHRHKWPAFARLWDAALAQGYARLEAELVGAACNLFSARDLPAAEADGASPVGMNADLALRLLALHRRQVREAAEAAARAPEPHSEMDVEALRARISARIEAIIALRDQQAAEGEAG